ncbi:MAG TPA: gamma-glutamyltransferase family protein [Burkholderiales bacterium]|nr:gamma-glutamyltransferase family protein [Burkholderiales bacterium]
MATYRPTITGARHMVSAGHYSAAHAAFQILEAGGNAIDAGVAAGICVGVLQTDRVNFAGVAPIMIYLAQPRKVINIDGLGTWPKAASIEYFRREHGGAMPPGILRTVMPAAPAAWIKVLAEYGTMSFGEVAAAAIRLTRDGFSMHEFMAEYIRDHEASYRRWPSSAEVFLPNGRPPKVPEIFVQKELAASIQYMVDEEAAHAAKGRAAGLRAARDAFYKGDIAQKIVKYHKENGGWVTADDLASYDVRVEQPLTTRYRDVDLYACGPWSQGPVLPQALNILREVDLKALGHNSPAYIHHLAEALKLAFADRHRYYGDPRFVEVPLDVLLSREYATARRKLIRDAEAWPEMPPAGNVKDFAAARPLPQPTAGEPAPLADTSYAAVIDEQGNAFSTTPSDGSSATPVIPGTGLCPSSRGSQSWTDPEHPAALAPGKRPRLTPNPALALKNGKIYMPFGSPGNDIQPQAMLQVFLNVVLWEMEPQAAVEAPRFATYSFPSSSEPHAYHPGRLNLESRIDAATVHALAKLGHKVAPWSEIAWQAGAVCAIRVNEDTGLLEGAADPRRPCYALGV